MQKACTLHVVRTRDCCSMHVQSKLEAVLNQEKHGCVKEQPIHHLRGLRIFTVNRQDSLTNEEGSQLLEWIDAGYVKSVWCFASCV